MLRINVINIIHKSGYLTDETKTATTEMWDGMKCQYIEKAGYNDNGLGGISSITSDIFGDS
jgi:hypothetical protein